jgi:hypothetical protein
MGWPAFPRLQIQQTMFCVTEAWFVAKSEGNVLTLLGGANVPLWRREVHCSTKVAKPRGVPAIGWKLA